MNEKYYLGLDVGTNSVGYAVTDEKFNLRKYKGEPMWGTHVFEEGKQCSDVNVNIKMTKKWKIKMYIFQDLLLSL